MTEEARLSFLSADIAWQRKSGCESYWVGRVDGDTRTYHKLSPGDHVPPHKDHGRMIHFVLQSSEGAVCVCDGVEHDLQQGNIYEWDTDQMHSSFNCGEGDRIHMICT